MPATRKTTTRTTPARAKRPARAAARQAAPATIDEYLQLLRADQRAAVQRLRTVIAAAAPGAEECISYRIPAFRLHGRGLIWFGAGAAHSAIYGVSEAYPGQFEGYDTSGKGTLRFPLDAPVPAALVRELVKGRIARVSTKAKAAKPAGRSRGSA
jgi:uncharacterized protein YdhG (YjbR/CyaY superfamily)